MRSGTLIGVTVVVVCVLAPPTLPGPPSHGGPQRSLVLDGSPVHNVGSLWVHASNWGAIGSMPGSSEPFQAAPSAQWPGGSNVEYLYIAGLWVGGLVNGVPAVSTAAGEAFEFRPGQGARDIVYRATFGAPHGARVPAAAADDDGDGRIDEDHLDGYDNDGDGLVDEDYAAISDQMLSRVFRDDTPEATSAYPSHNPMHLAVREESYQFSDPQYGDFVGFTFWITNSGTEPIDEVYIGMFADGDAGNRQTENYYEDDLTGFAADIPVDFGAHGTGAYDFAYWYDNDGDGGETGGDCGFVVLDHATDPAGVSAPSSVGIVSYAAMSGRVGDDGEPVNDLERYQFMSSRLIRSDPPGWRDYRSYCAVGPFAHIEPGETIPFSCALVVTPHGDFTNVRRAAEAYGGQWFDLDHDPSTGIDGKEHQEHWYLPGDHPTPLTITYFASRAQSDAVNLQWELWEDAAVTGFEILRARGEQPLRPLINGMLPADVRAYVDMQVEPGVRYRYQLRAHDHSDAVALSPLASAYVPSGQLILRQNAPNPFAVATTLSYSLPAPADVKLTVYDVSGRRVATVFAGQADADEHEVQWNATDDNGKPVSAGIYFCRIQAGNQSLTRKLVVVR